MDLTPDNVVFRDGHAVALIDFDADAYGMSDVDRVKRREAWVERNAAAIGAALM